MQLYPRVPDASNLDINLASTIAFALAIKEKGNSLYLRKSIRGAEQEYIRAIMMIDAGLAGELSKLARNTLWPTYFLPKPSSNPPRPHGLQLGDSCRTAWFAKGESDKITGIPVCPLWRSGVVECLEQEVFPPLSPATTEAFKLSILCLNNAAKCHLQLRDLNRFSYICFFHIYGSTFRTIGACNLSLAISLAVFELTGILLPK